ncbi:MAG TPA: GlxA family transcriptional regulator [Xanthobacteraceae bacterium]|nr:GlxA family transcriptional regulator [Xanthobacteraceae bacterium]
MPVAEFAERPEARAESGSDYVTWLDSVWSRRLPSVPDRRPELSIGILLWPGFPMMSLAGIVEPLRHAGDFGDNSQPVHCRWSVVGERSASVAASCGLRVQPDLPYVNPTDFDYIVVIGGLLPQLRAAPSRHRDYLRVAASAGVPLIGVCTGIFVLAQEGLLAGRKVAVHPFHREDFQAAFPSLRITSRDDFLSDGDRITVPGGVSILSLMADLVRTHCGADRAAKVAHQLSLADQPAANAFDRSRVSNFRYSADPRIQRAVVMIESRMGQDAVPDDIATRIGLSSRQFGRLFKEQLGMSPKKFIIETRLRYARWLIENTRRSITEIAYETGFSDCAHLATSFKAKYGKAPTQCR